MLYSLRRGCVALVAAVAGCSPSRAPPPCTRRICVDVYGHGAGPRTPKRVAAADSASLAPLAGRYELVSPNQRDTLRLDISAEPGMLRMWDSSLQRMRYLLPDDSGGFFDFDTGSQFVVEREGGPARRQGYRAGARAGYQPAGG